MSDDLIGYWRGLKLGDHLAHLPDLALAAAKDAEIVAGAAANVATVVEQGPGLHYRAKANLRLLLGAGGASETPRAFLQRKATFLKNLATARQYAANASGVLVTSGILAFVEDADRDVAELSGSVSAAATALPTVAGMSSAIASGDLLYVAGGGKEELVTATAGIPGGDVTITPVTALVNAYPAGAVVARVLYAFRTARVQGEAIFEGGGGDAFGRGDLSLDFVSVDPPEWTGA